MGQRSKGGSRQWERNTQHTGGGGWQLLPLRAVQGAGTAVAARAGCRASSRGWVQGWSEGWMALLTRPWLSGCCGFSRSCHAPPPCLVFAGGQELSHGQAKRGEGSGEEKGQAR